MNENIWKREDKVEITEGWNTTRYQHTYDPLGEVFFFAAGPFFKPPVFLAPAFAFGRGLLRERSSSFLSPTSVDSREKIVQTNILLDHAPRRWYSLCSH